MGVDFHWIRTSISSGISHSGFGNIVSSAPSTGGGGFPPYGTILGSGTSDSYLSYYYEPYTNILSQFVWGSHTYEVWADGNGGSFDVQTSETETASYNTVIDDNLDHSSTTRIIYKGTGNWSECRRYSPTGNSTIGSIYVYPSEGSYIEMTIGSYSTGEFYDGLCGLAYETNNSYYSYGTLIGTQNNLNFFSDGNGGYYYESAQASNPSYGTFLYADGGSSDLTWYAPNGTDGTWTYSSWGCSYYADGNGGSYSQCGGNTQPYGTMISDGYYEDAGSHYFMVRFDGNNSYFIEYF